jgi:hypothetical protein
MAPFSIKFIESLFNDLFRKKIIDTPSRFHEIQTSEFNHKNYVSKTIPVKPSWNQKGVAGRNWVVVIQTVFESVDKTSAAFIKIWQKLLKHDRLSFIIYRLYLSENSLGQMVVTIKLYCRTKSNFTYSAIYNLFWVFESKLSIIQSLSLKKQSQGNSVVFIKSFILECDNNDWQNQIFWVGESSGRRYENNRFIIDFDFLEKSKTDHTIPKIWKKNTQK